MRINKGKRFFKRISSRVIGFSLWSSLMVIVGAIGGDFLSIAKSHAEPSQGLHSAIVRLDKVRLGGQDLGEFSPYEPERGDLISRGYDYYYSDDEQFGLGVWESKPGSMVYSDLQYDEVMIVLDGSLVMTQSGGDPEIFSAGEGLVLPHGWSGTLTVPEEGARKIWVSYMGGIKGQQPK